MEDLVLSCLESRVEENRNLYARFLVGPFLRGDALTVATALRRVLLSSVESIGITHLYIQGITHEFSTVVGVRESVLELSLNFGAIVLSYDKTLYQKKNFFDKPQIGYLQVRGPKVIYANHLKLPLGVKLVDPTQYIATVSKEGSIVLKFIIGKRNDFIHPNIGSQAHFVNQTKDLSIVEEVANKNIVRAKKTSFYKNGSTIASFIGARFDNRSVNSSFKSVFTNLIQRSTAYTKICFAVFINQRLFLRKLNKSDTKEVEFRPQPLKKRLFENERQKLCKPSAIKASWLTNKSEICEQSFVSLYKIKLCLDRVKPSFTTEKLRVKFVRNANWDVETVKKGEKNQLDFFFRRKMTIAKKLQNKALAEGTPIAKAYNSLLSLPVKDGFCPVAFLPYILCKSSRTAKKRFVQSEQQSKRYTFFAKSLRRNRKLTGLQKGDPILAAKPIKSWCQSHQDLKAPVKSSYKASLCKPKALLKRKNVFLQHKAKKAEFYQARKSFWKQLDNDGTLPQKVSKEWRPENISVWYLKTLLLSITLLNEQREANKSITTPFFKNTVQKKIETSRPRRKQKNLKFLSNNNVFESNMCLRNVIPLDLTLTPVLKVNFVVEIDDEVLYLRQKIRERIILEVWTNGSIHPRQAVHDSSLRLLDMFASFRSIYQGLRSNRIVASGVSKAD